MAVIRKGEAKYRPEDLIAALEDIINRGEEIELEYEFYLMYKYFGDLAFAGKKYLSVIDKLVKEVESNGSCAN